MHLPPPSIYRMHMRAIARPTEIKSAIGGIGTHVHVGVREQPRLPVPAGGQSFETRMSCGGCNVARGAATTTPSLGAQLVGER